jgi:hypothetical protein
MKAAKNRGHSAGGNNCLPIATDDLCNDVINADRFARQHGAKTRYIHKWRNSSYSPASDGKKTLSVA